MIDLEFYIKKLQDLEYRGEWKEMYLHTYEKCYELIYNSHYLKKIHYIEQLKKLNEQLLDLPFATAAEDKLEFRKTQKHIIDLLYLIKEENKKIFIAHGKDTTMLDRVSAYLGKLRLDYVAYERSERKIKSFRNEAKECGYAIILFSADELARPLAGKSTEKIRTSQEVILQLGFFLSQVGSKNMMILYTEDKEIESPIDFDDLVYAPFDSKGTWRKFIASELGKNGIYVETDLVG